MTDDDKRPATVSDKSHESQPYDNRTAQGTQHNYQAANATDPNQLAEDAAEKLQPTAKVPPKPEEDFRRQDVGGP